MCGPLIRQSRSALNFGSWRSEGESIYLKLEWNGCEKWKLEWVGCECSSSSSGLFGRDYRYADNQSCISSCYPCHSYPRKSKACSALSNAVHAQLEAQRPMGERRPPTKKEAPRAQGGSTFHLVRRSSDRKPCSARIGPLRLVAEPLLLLRLPPHPVPSILRGQIP